MRGGRLVALGSALFQVARHIKFNRDSDSDRESGKAAASGGEAGAKLGASEPAGENQNLFETKGSDANKIEAESK